MADGIMAGESIMMWLFAAGIGLLVAGGFLAWLAGVETPLGRAGSPAARR